MTSTEADANEAAFLIKCKSLLRELEVDKGTEKERLQRVFERKEWEVRV